MNFCFPQRPRTKNAFELIMHPQSPLNISRPVELDRQVKTPAVAVVGVHGAESGIRKDSLHIFIPPAWDDCPERTEFEQGGRRSNAELSTLHDSSRAAGMLITTETNSWVPLHSPTAERPCSISATGK